MTLTQTIQIESSTLVVEILPHVGGKVAQIRSKLSGAEYLVPPQRPYKTIATNGDWLQHDTSGMDDCFPNVAAGMYPHAPWAEVSLPDLGEWTHGAWEVTGLGGREVTLQRSATTLPYVTVKTVRFADEDTLEFSYRVSNYGASPLTYLWSAHPLIAVKGSYEILLPAGGGSMVTFPFDGESRAWPMKDGIDLSREWLPEGKTLKVFVSDLGGGWCTLRQPSHSLHFAFNLEELPTLGIWFNNYGFPAGGERFRCIAIEPCTSATDLLQRPAGNLYPQIPAGGSVHWTMRLSILTHPISAQT